MKTLTILFSLLCLLGISQLSYSKIYKWVDKNGELQFSDQPPQKKHKDQKVEQIEIKINSVSNPNLSENPLEIETDNADQASARKVIMYSASWCGVCKHAKKYFRQQGIAYKEFDIETSARGRRDFKRLRGRGVPIILVGKQRMDGFDASAFEKMYQG